MLQSPDVSPELGLADERGFLAEHFVSFERDEYARDPSPARLVRLSMALLASGLASEAAELLEAHRLEPDYWVQHYFAVALIRSGRREEGLSVLRNLIERAGSDHRPLHTLGRIFLQVHDYPNARVELERACEQRDADALTFNDCAVAAMGQGDFRHALRRLRGALTRDEQCTPALNNAGVCYQQRGDTRKALQMYLAALQADPECTPAIHNIAEAYIADRKFPSAIGLLETYRRRRPLDLRALERLAWAHGSFGSHDQAIRLLQEGVRLSGEKDATLLNNLAVALSASGKAPKAETAYQKAVSLDPSNLIFRLNYATLAGGSQRWALVLNLLPSKTEVSGNSDGLVLRCTALAETGAYDAARIEAEAARALFPNDPRIVVILGFLLACRLNELDSAIELLRAGNIQHPAEIGIANNLAYALVKVGLTSEARTVLEAHLVEIEKPTMPVSLLARATWGLMLVRENQFDEGMRYYRLARNGASPALRARLDQKILVERGRHALAGQRWNEAKVLLANAAAMASDAEFTSEAEELLAHATPRDQLN